MIIVELSFKQQTTIPPILLEMILFNDNFKEQTNKCCICFLKFLSFYFLLYSVPKCLACSAELSLINRYRNVQVKPVRIFKYVIAFPALQQYIL
jgi:hypothetical protein